MKKIDTKIKNSIIKKSKRVLETYKEFVNCGGNISDSDIAKKLNSRGIETSRSTVARDLTDNLIEIKKYGNFVDSFNNDIEFDKVPLTSEQQKEIESIFKKRQENLELAKSKGGASFASKNEALKDENGKFKGSRKRV